MAHRGRHAFHVTYCTAVEISIKLWRNIDELKGTEMTYTDSFLKLKAGIAVALKYHEKNQIIQTAIKNASKSIVQKVSK